MKPDNRFVTLFGICFIILSLSIGFGISQERKPLEKVSKEVSGIVIHREEGAIWIRLTSVDSLNNISTGTVFMYNLTDKNSDTKSGEYIRGTLLSGNSLLIQESYAFFDRDGGRGFVNKGDLLLISGGKITWDHSDPYPSFSLNVKNLGETEIIGIRASINGAHLKTCILTGILRGMTRFLMSLLDTSRKRVKSTLSSSWSSTRIGR